MPNRCLAGPDLARNDHKPFAYKPIEDLAGSESLLQHWPALEALAQNDDPRVRADACHFLALTEDVRAVPLLEALQKDPERAVRDVADDSLEELTAALQQAGNWLSSQFTDDRAFAYPSFFSHGASLSAHHLRAFIVDLSSHVIFAETR